MDRGLSPPELSALAELRDALGEGGGSGDCAAEGASQRPGPAGLAAVLGALSQKARALAGAERRARQAASTYRAASLALSRSPDSGALLEELLDYLSWIVVYDAAQVLIALPGGELEPRASRDWRSGRRPPAFPAADALARRAGGRSLVEEAGADRVLCVPLHSPGDILGAVLVLREGGEGRTPRAFDEEELRAAEAFAGQAAAALRNASLFEGLRRADEELLRSYDTSIEVISKTLDLRDHETEGHSLRVAALAAELGREMGMGPEELQRLRRGALLHDVGKIGVPDAILLKPGSLDAGEIEAMRLHPVYARDLLEGIPFLRQVIEVPWCHHERWDGSGYPRGLAGAEIPLAARVFSVADVWDAVSHDRPYRAAMAPAQARELVERGAGSQFDPAVVACFARRFPEDGQGD